MYLYVDFISFSDKCIVSVSVCVWIFVIIFKNQKHAQLDSMCETIV